MAVGEDDAAGLVDDEAGGVAGAGDLGVEGARRGGAEDGDGGHDAGERAAPVLRRDARLDLHRQLPADLLLHGALHRGGDLAPRRASLPMPLGFRARHGQREEPQFQFGGREGARERLN